MFLQLTAKLYDFIVQDTLIITSKIGLGKSRKDLQDPTIQGTPANTMMVTKFPPQGGHSVSAFHSS
jgi:hypothetical protein